MNKFYFLFLSICLFIVKINTKLEVSELHETWNAAQELLQQLRDFVEVYVDTLLYEIKSFLESIEFIRFQLTVYVEESAKAIGEDFNNDLGNIIETGINAGIDISVCLIGHEEEPGILKYEVLQRFSKCADGLSKYNNNLVMDILNVVNGTIGKNIDELETLLSECDKTDAQCIDGVIEKINHEDTQSAALISDSHKNFTFYVTSWTYALEACQDSQLNYMRKRGEEILYEIEKCVHDMIDNQSKMDFPRKMQDIPIKDLWDVAYDLLQELKDYLQIIVDAASFITDNYTERLNNTFNTVEYNLQIDLEESFENFINDIDDIKKMGQNASVDIAYCLNGREEELRNYTELVLQRYDVWLKGLSKRISQRFENTRSKFNETIANVDEFENLLKNCDRNDTQCISEVIVKIANEESLSSISILKENTKYLTLLISNTEIADGFAKLQHDQMVDRSENILQEIIKCVNQIIGKRQKVA